MKEALQFVIDLWRTGDFWLLQALALTLIWPLVLIGIALLGLGPITPLAALMPLAALVFLYTTRPVISVVVAASQGGQSCLHWLVLLVLGELVTGIYLIIGSVWNDV